MLHPPDAVLPSKDGVITKQSWIASNRISKYAAQDRSNNKANVEAHGHQQKRSRLKPTLVRNVHTNDAGERLLLLLNDLSNHRPHDTDIPVQRPSKSPEDGRL